MRLRFPKPVLRDTEDPRRFCRQCGKPFVKSRLSSTLCRDCADAKRAKRQKRRRTLRKASGRLRGRNNSLNDRDEQAKVLLGYKHPRSFVRAGDQSEVLFGVDWETRCIELRQRSEGICENTLETGQRCCATARDPHHLTRRSVYRDDRLRGLLDVCGPCHKILDGRNTKFGETDDEN